MTVLKRWVRAAVVAGAVLALATVASAEYNPNGEALPADATEVSVFEFDQHSGEWVPIGKGNVEQGARSWNSGATQGRSNQAYWDVSFTTHASVAQWVDWSLATTRKDWRIRRPGDYAADSIDFTVRSNNAVVVSFDGFNDLRYLNPDGAPEGARDYIETYYSIGPSFEAANAAGWVRASALNEMTVPFDAVALADGESYKVWQRLVVDASNPSSEYENVGTVRLAVTNLKFWVDAASGNFAQDQSGQPPAEPYVPPTI